MLFFDAHSAVITFSRNFLSCYHSTLLDFCLEGIRHINAKQNQRHNNMGQHFLHT